jgi:hypothetical protein
VAILVFLDGVLKDTRLGGPIQDGMSLYRTLKEKNRVLILCDDVTKGDHWLRQQRINNIDDVVDKSNVPALGDDPDFRLVEWIKSQGPVEMVITSDPDLTVKLLSVGITTLVFMAPTYIREEFRPDSRRGVKSWQKIVEEIDSQNAAYKEDPRI